MSVSRGYSVLNRELSMLLSFLATLTMGRLLLP